MKKYYFIFLVLVIILALSACGNSNGSEEILQEDNQVYEEPEDKGMSLEEARQLYEGGGHAFFVKEKDKDSYYPVEEIKCIGPYNSYVFNLTGANEIAVIDDNRQLINLQSFDEYECFSLEGQSGIAFPLKVGYSDDDQFEYPKKIEKYELNEDNMEESFVYNVESLNGMSFVDFISKSIVCYEKDGYVERILPAEEGEMLTIGNYNATEYIKESVIANMEYYIPDNKEPIMLATEKTKDGYGVMNVDALPAGKYYIDTNRGFGEYYWFEIKK